MVTDLREPLHVVHGRIMRRRLLLGAVWLVGWIVSGVLWRDGWLATTILLGSGPGLWLVVGLLRATPVPGRREPVSPRAPGGRALGARAPEGPGAGAAR